MSRRLWFCLMVIAPLLFAGCGGGGSFDEASKVYAIEGDSPEQIWDLVKIGEAELTEGVAEMGAVEGKLLEYASDASYVLVMVYRFDSPDLANQAFQKMGGGTEIASGFYEIEDGYYRCLISDVIYLASGYQGSVDLVLDALSGQTEATAPSNYELIAYYPFEDDGDDASGYGYHGEIYGATFVEGIKGNGLQFDGVNDYVQTSFSSNRQPLTISVWFKPDDTTGEQSIVDSDMWGNSGQSLILGYWDEDGTLDVEYHSGYYNSSFAVQSGLWYHAVVVFTSGRIELYVNGELAGLDVFNQDTLDGDNFRIGRHNADDPQWFSGVIDEVRIYDRALPAEEVYQLYNSED